MAYKEQIKKAVKDSGLSVKELKEIAKRIPKTPPTKLFLLHYVDMSFCGNSPFWWAKNGAGYTIDFDKAQTFTYEDAIKTIKGCEGTHRFAIYEKAVVEKAVFRTVDYQKIKIPKEKK